MNIHLYTHFFNLKFINGIDKTKGPGQTSKTKEYYYFVKILLRRIQNSVSRLQDFFFRNIK